MNWSPHLQASEVDLELVDFSKPSLLLVEDFGTFGLQGAIDHDDGESLSLFWRNIGESHKGGSRGGRWGLGKTVFVNSSRISTWFGLTIRADNPNPLLIGQVALRKHQGCRKNLPAPCLVLCLPPLASSEIPPSLILNRFLPFNRPSV